MRLLCGLAVAVTVATFIPVTTGAQDSARPIEDGGITVPGWTGKIDPNEQAAGLALENAKLAPEGDGMRVMTGPAVTYWNPSNRATGSYTVSATFNEPEYMNRNNHPHPYGIVVAGNDMGTDSQTFLYCAAYGNGNFIVRGFGPAPFQMNGRRGGSSPAVNQAAGPGSPVTQEIAMAVKDDAVDCVINGTVVGSYPKADLVTAGKLTSTDGIYGIRFGHNTEAIVTGFEMTQD